MKKLLTRKVCFCLLGTLSTLSIQAHASGYKMEFQSASVLADAGEAAVVEDAGTNWYNSAGLVYLPRQLVASAIELYTPVTFRGTATAPPVNPFVATLAPEYGYTATGTASSHPNSLIPGIHFSLPINERWAFGISTVPAWGFTEDYGLTSIVRYDLTRIYTKTLDIAPSLAYKINNQWSVGAGPDINYFSVLSRNESRTEGPPALLGTQGDSLSRYSADDWNTGFHAGVLFRPTDTTRFGLNYRSKIVMHLTGYSDFALNNGPSYETNRFRFNIPLPPVTTLSVYHDINPIWAVMGTISYDQWNVLRAYNAYNYIGPPSPTNPSGLVNASVPQNMDNTIDLSAGLHYKWNEQWMLRANVKYEPTPTINQNRDINFPDGEKLGFQIGARYTMSQKLAFDFLLGRVLTRTTQINGVNPVTGATTIGTAHTNIYLAGAQAVWNI